MESTRDDARGAHEGEGRAPRGQVCPGPSWPHRKVVAALLSPQESQYPDRNHVQISSQSKLRISGNIRNGESAESGNAETERDRETNPISERLSPLPCHGGQGPEGKPFSHLGRRSRNNKKKVGPSPPCFRWHRNAAGGHHHHCDLHQHLHHLPPSIFCGPLSRNPLYPLLEHGALCFILLSNDVLPSYDV